MPLADAAALPRRYSEAVIETLVDAVVYHGRQTPDRPFCIFESARRRALLTFGGMLRQSTAVAARTAGYGIARGDVVLLFFDQSERILPCFVGLQMTGAIPSLMPLPSEKQHPAVYWGAHEALFRRIRPKAVICEDRFVGALRPLQSGQNWLLLGASELADMPSPELADAPWRQPVAPDDIALLQHSSGTTAIKKGVMLSHRAIVAHVERYRAALAGDASRDIIASWLPYYHDMGLIACFMLPLVAGATVVLQDPFEWAARPISLLESIERHRATLCWLPNFAFEHLARARRKERLDLSSMRAFINCSEPCKSDSFVRFAEKFKDCGVTPAMLQTCYASAETVFAVTQSRLGTPPKSLRIDRTALETAGRVAAGQGRDERAVEVISCGPPIAGVEVTILDAAAGSVPEGRVGRIAVHGDAIFDGYYGLPDETAKCMKNGWYLSRELGFLAGGELYVLGREDDLIIVNGKNLFAHDVEYLLGGVAELKPGRSVAFGVFSEELGSEELVAVAELRGDAAADRRALQRDIKQLILDHAGILPREIHLVAEGWLVKTTSGKISRSLNRNKYLAERGRAPGPAVPVAEPMEVDLEQRS